MPTSTICHPEHPSLCPLDGDIYLQDRLSTAYAAGKPILYPFMVACPPSIPHVSNCAVRLRSKDLCQERDIHVAP